MTSSFLRRTPGNCRLELASSVVRTVVFSKLEFLNCEDKTSACSPTCFFFQWRSRLCTQLSDVTVPPYHVRNHPKLSLRFFFKAAKHNLEQSLRTRLGITHYWHNSTLLNSMCFSLSIFKVPTTTWGYLPGHILTKWIINWLLDGNADWKWEKLPRIWTVNDWWLPKLTLQTD